MTVGRTSPGGDDSVNLGQLLERNDDWARLSDLIDRVARGSGGLAVVEGPAGIGKTRLIRDTKAAAVARGSRWHRPWAEAWSRTSPTAPCGSCSSR